MLLLRLERDRDRILRWIVPRSSSSHDWVRCIVIPVRRGEGRGGEGGREGRRRGGEERRGGRRYCYKPMDTPHWSEKLCALCHTQQANLKHV